MAITLEGSETKTGSGSIAINIPAGTEDIFIVVAGWSNNSVLVDELNFRAAASTIDLTEVVDAKYTGTVEQLVIYHMNDGHAQWPGTGSKNLQIGFTSDTYNEGPVIGLAYYSGLDQTTPYSDIARDETSPNTELATLQVSNVGASDRVLGSAYAYDTTSNSMTGTPTGYTDQTVVARNASPYNNANLCVVMSPLGDDTVGFEDTVFDKLVCAVRLVAATAPGGVNKTDSVDVDDTVIANITRAPSAVLFDRYAETINQKYALDFDAVRDLRLRVKGWFLEDSNATGPPPVDASGANLGAADYNNDGASESPLDDIGGTLFRQGQLRLNQAFTDLFTDKVIVGDGSRDGQDYFSGNLPGPWSVNSPAPIGEHSFHQAWAFRVRREADWLTGVLRADGVSVNSDRGYYAFAATDLYTYWQHRILAETFLQPDAANRLGYSALIDHYELDPYSVNSLSETDYAYMRRQWGLAMLHPHGIPAPRIAGTYPVPVLDEAAVTWGQPVGNWYMATLDVSSGAVTLRPQDVANGNAQVFSYGCVVMNTHPVTSGWWPADQPTDNVGLPVPPSGRRWTRFNATSYGNQDPTFNSGAAITNSDGTYPYGYVQLRRGEAMGLLHEPIPIDAGLTRETTVGIDEPMRRAVYCTTDWRNVYAATHRGEMMKYARFVWHQGIGAEISSQREDTFNRLTAWRNAAQEDALLMLHKLPEYVKINEPAVSDGKKYLYNAVWKVSGRDPDEHLLKRGNGNLVMAEGGVAVAPMYKDILCIDVAKEFWEDWADIDGTRTGQYDMVTYTDESSVAAIYIFDSIPPWQVDIYGQQLFESVCLSKAAANEYTLNYWSAFVEAGAPDGDGFYSDWSAYDNKAPKLYGRRNPRTGSYGGEVTGVKHNGTSSTTVRYNNGADATDGAVGDDITIFNTDRSGYAADWNEDGVDENRTNPEAVYRAQQVIQMHTAWQNRFETITGRKCPKAGNMVNAAHQIFRNGLDAMGLSNPFLGAIELPTYENWTSAIGILPWDGTGFEVRGIYDPDQVARGIGLGRALLKKDMDYSNQFPGLTGSETLADPSVVLAWELGGPDIPNGVTEDSVYLTYSGNPHFASVARWASAVGLLQDIATSIAGTNSSSDPWLCEEQFFWPGVPLDDALRVVFTFDYLSNTVSWNPAHFGTHGYVIPFSEGLAIINFRDGLSSGDYAQYLPVNDGTTGDLVTVNGQSLEAYSQAIDGKSVYMFDGANYTHRTTDQTSNLYGFQPSSVPAIIHDYSFNDGQLLTTKFPSGLRCVAPGGMILRRA